VEVANWNVIMGGERSRRVECSVAVQEEWKTLASCTLLFLWVKHFEIVLMQRELARWLRKVP